MALRSPPLLSLQQMAMVKLAVPVCNDPEVQDLVIRSGSLSFVFPSKETEIFMNRSREQFEGSCANVFKPWTWNDFLINGSSKHSYRYCPELKKRRVTLGKLRKGTLPFGEWEELVEKKMSSFMVPYFLRPKLLDLIRSVTVEIDIWIKDHSFILVHTAQSVRTAQSYFQWTSYGRIDRVKTARTLIIKDVLHIEDLYILALHYGLMDDMFSDTNRNLAWKKLAEKEADFLASGSTVTFVCKTFTGESDFNYIALRNFFSESTPDERVQCLNTVLSMDCLQYEDLLFGLSKMDDNEKSAVFKTHPLKLLMYFLDWPLQSQFLDAAECLLSYFTETDFRVLLIFILYERIMVGWKDFDYIQLLKELWSRCPSPLKQCVTSEDCVYDDLMYTVNYSNNAISPKEHLLESYDEICLPFGYRGTQYWIYNGENRGSVGLGEVSKPLAGHHRYVHEFYFC
ncbi:uncharacterized protein NPIL_413431 [Nephila pilipes]|uniref:Uncharacterized protein n=1 Tax=Nephila pilipes TaxID=299642 RepID=A0A8X6QGG6_NEPPI|nr:uncharacterized protein NPIL_413431 [Nephila pilipes]